MRTLIVDHGLCNIDSIARAVEECGGDPVVVGHPDDSTESVDRAILPGVGSFSEAMQVLTRRGWDRALTAYVKQDGVPLLGICLGMQLLATEGTEGGVTPGLNLVPGRVVLMDPDSPTTRVPHVGWNEVVQDKPSRVLDGIPDRKDFYFVHSYHFVPSSQDAVLGTTPYCGRIVSVVGWGNVFGVQFHPEKSLPIGFKVLRNFLEN